MIEKMPVMEKEAAPPPLWYERCAVPLDPWHAPFPGDTKELYVYGSLRSIDEKVQTAMEAAVASGLVDAAIAPSLDGLVRRSLYSSQMHRIDLNTKAMQVSTLDDIDERVRRMKNGVASPSDVIGVIVDNPKAGSAELAKQFHPFDNQAFEGVEAEVLDALEAHGFTLLEDEPARYKLKRMEEDIPVAIVLRKQVVAERATEHGMLRVVERKSLLVRGDEHANSESYFGRLVKNPDRFGELAERIDACYPHLIDLPNLKWLQMQATSYYAKYPSKEAATPRSARQFLLAPVWPQ